MNFFNATEPIVRRKQTALDVQDLSGLLEINLTIGNRTLFSKFYTRIDQALLLWAIIAFLIFTTAQFFPISWVTQGYLWSIVTVVASAMMIGLTRFWTKVEQLGWVMYLWASLMIGGLILTNCGIFLGWSWVLMNLCSLWLGISAVGYLITGLGLQSRLFILMSLVHAVGMMVLPTIMGWQFFVTGSIIAGSLVFLSEVQWDMRDAIDSPVLSASEKQFNQQQYQLRQS